MRNEELKRFMFDNSPAMQSEMASKPKECMFGEYPTLKELKRNYGTKADISWMIPQLIDISEFCGAKNKLDNDQIMQTAMVISSEYGYLKTSELMLFFHYLKAGRYGIFYGSVDPMKITTALRQFLVDRNDYFYRLDQKERERKREEARKGAVTYEEYQQLVKEGKV